MSLGRHDRLSMAEYFNVRLSGLFLLLQMEELVSHIQRWEQKPFPTSAWPCLWTTSTSLVSGFSLWSLLPPGSFLMKLMGWACSEVSQHKGPSMDLDPPCVGWRLGWAECPHHSAASPSSLAGIEESREHCSDGISTIWPLGVSPSTAHPNRVPLCCSCCRDGSKTDSKAPLPRSLT